ncbi:TOPRIM nucleotidyl transferase/hydrolase domain-containing protein [Microbacterium sp. LWH12-1.2]|uniref:TOPRIM nucleotidyl transferase/hydrolase domain-containing protein n=1 Tax=Microbacterium sp. LWH12-1.2 TaxID=3135259 RepID=UPI0034184EEC
MPKTDAASHTVVLFEGESDLLAFEALGRRFDAVIDPKAVSLVNMGGITNLRRRLAEMRPAAGSAGESGSTRVLGLYDTAERRYVVGVLVDSGILEEGGEPDAAGFFGCERDLEEEVIAAAGSDLVLDTLAERGELARFRVFQDQPAQRARTIQAQLHRFAGTAAGRKARFAADIVDALPIERMPPPLVALLDAVLQHPESVENARTALNRRE